MACPPGSPPAPLPGSRAAPDRSPPASFARADSTGPNGIHWEATTSASKPVDRKESSDCWTPANADCTNSRDPPSHNRFDADSHSGSSTSRPSGPAFHAHDGPAPGETTSPSSPAEWARRADWTPRPRTAHSRKPLSTNPPGRRRPPRRRAALSREHRTACGQMSKAVTLAQPISAAAIATYPLPVHRSSTRRPGNRSRSFHCVNQQVANRLAADTPRRLPRRQPGPGTWSSRVGLSSDSPWRSRHDLGNARKPTGLNRTAFAAPVATRANCSMKVEQNAGRSEGERLVIKLPSTTTSSSTT